MNLPKRSGYGNEQYRKTAPALKEADTGTTRGARGRGSHFGKILCRTHGLLPRQMVTVRVTGTVWVSGGADVPWPVKVPVTWKV